MFQLQRSRFSVTQARSKPDSRNIRIYCLVMTTVINSKTNNENNWL